MEATRIITVIDNIGMIVINDLSLEGQLWIWSPEGLTTAGNLKNSRKAYAWEVLQVIWGPPKKARIKVVISFDDNDLEGVKFPHDDPLVIMPVIDNSSVKRVLVDGGASVDILFHEAFLKMGYNDS